MKYLHEFLEAAAAASPEHVAIECGETRLTTARLAETSRIAAAWLASQGVKHGDRVVVEASNSAMTVVLIHAVNMAGGCFIPVHPSTPTEQRAYIAQDAGAVLILSAKSETWTAETISGRVAVPDLADLRSENAAIANGLLPASTLIGEDLACMIYTSGSTGRPKGVTCPHRQAVFAVGAIAEALDYRAGDRIFCAIPLSFDYGLYQVFLALASGCTLCLEDPGIGGLGLFKALKQSSADVLAAVPVMIETLAVLGRRKPGELPALRLITNTGAAPSPKSIRVLRDAFPGLGFQLMYGLTECKRVSIAPVDADLARPGTCGVPLRGTRVEVVDEAGQALPPGKTGEFVVSGPHLMAGYWNAQALTDATYRTRHATLRRLHTGDYGRMDAEGYLYCEGRRDDIFKVRGFRVSCTEIEAACAEAEDVQHAVMVPPTAGRSGTLFVSPGSADLRDHTDAGAKLRRFLAGRLEPHKVPEKIRYLAQMPRTANNKFDRKALVRLLEYEAMPERAQIEKKEVSLV